MSDWTDEELGALLSDTFRSRESLAPPEVAVRIASGTPSRHRRWPEISVAAAAVVTLLIGSAYVLGRPEAGSSSTSGAARTPHHHHDGLLPSDADYRRATADESARVLGLAPLPPGARRIGGKPGGWPMGGSRFSPSDSAFTQTAWYSVPISQSAVARFLLSHQPEGMTDKNFVSLGKGDGAWRYAYKAVQVRNPAAFTRPVLLVEWYDLGPRTVMRFDSAIAPRRARTRATYPSGTVTSVDVSRIKQHYVGKAREQVLSTFRLSATADPERLRQVVGALNGLVGAAINDSDYCGGTAADTGNRMTYRIVLHAARGDITYAWAEKPCPELDVTRAEQTVGVPLDPDNLYGVVGRILGT